MRGVEIMVEINTLGSVLKYYREKYKFTQEDLCYGICTPTKLSQIENGKKVVDSLLAEALLGRIGKTVLQFELLLNEKDYFLWGLREKIQKTEKLELYNKTQVLLEEYRVKMPNESVHIQFYLYHIARCKMFDNAPKEEICQILFNALMMTKKNYKIDDVFLYNPIEIDIIVLLVHFNYFKYNNENIEIELLKILIYVKKVYSGSLKQEVLIKILLELIEYKKKNYDYTCVIKYIDEAISFLSQGRTLEYVGELHFQKAQMLEKIYKNSKQWKIEKINCTKECLMAYHVFEIMEKEDKSKDVEMFCEEKLQWQIIK